MSKQLVENKSITGYIKTPVGILQTVLENDKLAQVNFTDLQEIPEDQQPTDTILRKISAEIRAYFQGKLEKFTTPIKFSGSEFQISVWEELLKIPYGKTVSYEELALKLGNKKLARAVGIACKTNHIAIVIPCHRVVGKNGNLTGYAGELWRKQLLIDHEQNSLVQQHNSTH